MDVKHCDICKKEISKIDRVYFVSYGEKSQNPFTKNKKNGEICQSCCKVIDEFIQKMKK